MCKELKNNCKFPPILGGKIRLSSNTKEEDVSNIIDINSEDFVDKKFFFSGNSVVVEKSREISPHDILLLLQIIEFHQKFKNESVVTISDKFEHTYSQEDKEKYIDLIRSYCQGEGKEAFQAVKNDEEAKARFLADLFQSKVDEENYNNFKIYANSKESYSIKIDVADLLKARGLRNQIENRKVVENSLKRLFNTSLVYYFLNETLQNKIKDIKKNKKYKEWKDEVKTCFYKNKHKSSRFYRHIIEAMNVNDDASIITVKINKGFLDFCDDSKYFNFDYFTNIKTDAAKNFYFNACFSYKEKLSKEYVYDLMDLNSIRDCKNLEKAKKAIEELKKCELLTDDSGYDRKTKMFNIKFSEEEKKKQGLVQQQKYSKGGKK